MCSLTKREKEGVRAGCNNMYRKKCKGNIMLSMMISLLVICIALSVYTSFIRDKHSTNLYIDRMNARTDINSYATMSHNFLYSYFANKKVELMYRQTVEVEGEGEDIEQRIVRTLVTNPYYIELEDLSLAEYKGEQRYLLREDGVLNFAGYKFNMKVYIDMPIDEANEKLMVFNNALAYNPEFMEDVNDVIKDENAYTVHIGDVPLIVVYEYDTWVQETKLIVSGLRFMREYFPILYYDVNDSLQGEVSEGEISTSTGVVNGYLLTDYIIFETMESHRERA